MKRKHSLSKLFTASIFFILIIMIPVGILTSNYLPFDFGFRGTPVFRFIFTAFLCAIIGTIVSKIITRNPINTIVEINKATKEIASGNYDIRIEENSPLFELDDMAHNFNLMAKELAMNDMMKNDFINNVSHEFKTPLSAIEGYATLLRNKPNDAQKVAEYAESIILNSKRLTKMTGNILLLSNLDNSNIHLDKKTYSISEQIREIILLFESEWTTKNIDLDIDLVEIKLKADEGLLSHVWQNLFSNAVKFCNTNGEIKLSLKKESDKMKFTISNTGAYINPQDLDRVFEKFYQSDVSRASKGNGLGLSIVKKVIDLHGGTINVLSDQNSVTTFTVTI